MEDNLNAEVWDFEKAKEFMLKCLELTKQKTEFKVGERTMQCYEYHFIGEVATELDEYSDLPLYISKKFIELKPIYNKIKSRLEANCFSDSKKGIIKEATAIMNLKANYGWTDRVDTTTKGENINKGKTVIEFKKFGKQDNNSGKV